MGDGHLRQAAHQQQRDETADRVAQDHAGAGQADGELAAQEEARPDRAADGDHAHLAGGEPPVQALFSFRDVVEVPRCAHRPTPRGATLRHRGAAEVLRPVPRAGVENVAQDLDGVPDVGVAQVERRDAEAQHLRLAVVADHAAGDQRLHHGVALRVAEADVAAAPRVIARRHQRQRMGGAPLFDQADEEIREGQRLGPDGRHVGLRAATSRPHSTSARDRIGCVPHRKRRIPLAGW